MQESLRVACRGKVTSDVHGKQVNVPPCHTTFAVYTAFATFTSVVENRMHNLTQGQSAFW